MKYSLIILFVIIHSIVSAQIITTIAGTGISTFSGEGVPAITAGTPNPVGGVFDKMGNYYFADGQNSNRIRIIDPFGVIKTIAGNGFGGFAGDGGHATAARLNTPNSIVFDTSGNVLINDLQNNRIRKIDISTGVITTIAGNGTATYSGDGVLATSSSLWAPQDICVDRLGNIYIADAYNARIRKVDVSGIISTYVGTGVAGNGGDGGPATNAQIALPSGLAIDDTGNLYIADVSNASNRVRKVNLSGIITTVAGNGTADYIGDGIPATSAQISPSKITIDSFNNLFIADRYNNRIYKVDGLGILHSIAGNGIAGDSGDSGPATSASLNYPSGVVLDECGNLYIPTVGSVAVPGSGRRIRKVTFNLPTTPTITLSGITTATVGATVTVSAAVSGAGSSYTIRWYRNSALFSTTTTPTTTFVKGSGTDIITARIVPTIVYCYDSTTAEPHLVLEAPVGLSSVSERQQYSVYPNPAQQQLSISSPAPIHTITISSPVGQQWLAYTGSGSTEVRLSVSHLPPGLYIVRVNNSYSTKMIKE